jgi:hypothetical protein
MGKIKDFDNFDKDDRDKFVLIKSVGNLKKGKTFDSFGGLVSAIDIQLEDGTEKTIRFDDTEYFKLK